MAGLKAAGVTGRGALVMAQQASSPIDMFNQVRDSVSTTCSGSRLPGLQDMSPRGPLIPKPSSYTCLRSDHPREQTFAKWSKGLYMPLPGSDQPGKNWQLNAAPGNRMHSLRLLGGSPALNLAPVQSRAGARTEDMAMDGGCSRFLALTQLRLEVGKGRVGQRQT